MTSKRQQSTRPTIVPDTPDTGEATMIANDTRQERIIDRRMRNRLILLNLVAWIVIVSLIWWAVA